LAKKFYRINQYIQAKKVRVVDDEGKQVGVLSIEKALKQAQNKGLDLVEVAPKAKPPVCKIIDFSKFKFLEAKKQQQDKKKSKKVELKVVQLSPFIAENDLNYRLKKAEEFLKEGDKVKISVVFKGRQITKKQFGYQLMEKALEKLTPFSEIDFEPKFVGRKLEMTLKPTKGGKSGKKAKDENKKVSQKKV
jgi:translation initiation factor IF-3